MYSNSIIPPTPLPGLAGYEGLGKFKLKKVIKKVTKPIVKPARKIVKKVAPVVAGTMPTSILFPGLTKKMFGIKSAKAEKLFKKSRKVGIGALAAAGAVLAAPVVVPMIGSALSSGASMMIGGLKFVGGKLAAMPSGLMNFFKSKGMTEQQVAQLPPEEIIKTAQEQGYITEQMLTQAAQLASQKGYIPPPVFQRAEMTPEGEYLTPEGTPTGVTQEKVAQAGMLSGIGLPVLAIGAIILLAFGQPVRRR